jgi:hypothetical protein
VALQPTLSQELLIHKVSRQYAMTHNTRQDSSGPEISSSQRPLPDNTKHTQQTDIHAHGGIRNPILSRRAVAELRLRPRGNWAKLHLDFIIHCKASKIVICFILCLGDSPESEFMCRRFETLCSTFIDLLVHMIYEVWDTQSIPKCRHEIKMPGNTQKKQ